MSVYKHPKPQPEERRPESLRVIVDVALNLKRCPVCNCSHNCNGPLCFSCERRAPTPTDSESGE